MYMMFVYVNGAPYNSMGIRGNLDEIYQEAEGISKDLFKQNPRYEVTTKITMYI